MSDIVVRVEKLGKEYRLGQTVGYGTLRDTIAGIFRPKLESTRARGETNEKIWALKDVSFEVNRGDVIGFLGGNGAGKSTLLKILSRITSPTEGYAEITGCVGCLLEVGTGFHPELTGKENVYFNGAILGMKKVEIDKKFNEIVEFSGVGKFLDTPVKHYSSGMQVRLAFAVAAHLETDILIVDEVLSVGDAAFQKKCLGKMSEVASGGRTVLVVSHNMTLVKTLCQRSILLDNGKVVEDGPTHQVIQKYLGLSAGTSAEAKWDDVNHAPGDDIVRMLAVRAKNIKGEIKTEFNIKEPVQIEIEFQILRDGSIIDNALMFKNESEVPLFTSINHTDTEWYQRKRPAGIYRSICNIPGNFLNEGTVVITAIITTYPDSLHAVQHDIISFHVFDPGSGGARGHFPQQWPDSAVRPLLDWKTEKG
jgi:lipopolysaccharide transport system ATP-binding protein